VQLTARADGEDVLLRVAAQLEQAAPWSIAPVWPARG
jgi:Asp-tRNA(Asn)/Glu-tRNA(Gln) amidotransferase A subunit family amidase